MVRQVKGGNSEILSEKVLCASRSRVSDEIIQNPHSGVHATLLERNLSYTACFLSDHEVFQPWTGLVSEILILDPLWLKQRGIIQDDVRFIECIQIAK